MRILIIIDSLDCLGGTQSYAQKLRHLLKKKYIHTDILSIKSSKHAEFTLNASYNFQVILNKSKINKIAKEYDRVIVVSGHIFGYLSFTLRHKNIIWRESNSPIERQRSLNPLKKLVHFLTYWYFTQCSHGSKLILPSQQCFHPYHSRFKQRVIHNFININEVSSDVYKREFTFVYAGRWNNIKGADRLIKAFKSSGLELHVFGPEPTTTVTSNIIFHGRWKSSEIFNKAKCLVLLSRYEGFPNVALEARAAGCKLIVSKENSWLKNVNILKNNVTVCRSDIELQSVLTKLDLSDIDGPLSDDQISDYNMKIVNEVLNFTAVSGYE